MSTTDHHGLGTIAERISAKLESSSYAQALWIYLLVEEIVAATGCQGAHVLLTEGSVEADSDSNLLASEVEILTRAFEATPRERHSHRLCRARAVTTFLKSPVEGTQNGNLCSIDRETSVDAASGSTALHLRMWFEGEDEPANFEHPARRDPNSLDDIVTALLRALEIRASWTEEELDEHDFVTVAGARYRSFLQEKREFFTRSGHMPSEDLIAAYNERFHPLQLITHRIEVALRQHLKRIDPTFASLPLVFSYRNFGESQISFHLTGVQMRKLLMAPEGSFTNHELRELMEFGFENIGLSGYVLRTGHSDFTPDPRNDPRWLSTAKDPSAGLVLRLLDRMYRALSEDGTGTGNEHVFLLPLFIRRERRIAPSCNIVQLCVECKLPADPERRRVLRRNMLDIQWSHHPLVETAILAQQQTQLRADSEVVQFVTSHAWTLGHNFPKFLSKPIQNSSSEIENITLTLERELLPHMNLEQLDRLARIRKIVNYLHFMAEHYGHFFTFFRGSLPGPEKTSDLRVDMKDLFNAAELADKIGQFASHYRDLLTRTNRPAEGVPEPGYRHMRLRFEAHAIDSRQHIYYNKALFLELMINHIGNSMDELARENGKLLVADPERGIVSVNVRLEPAEGSRPEIGFLAVSVTDRGPGIELEKLSEYQSTLDQILLHGETPRFQNARSGKAEHTGSGFLINAHILQSFRNSTVAEGGSIRLRPTDPSALKDPGLTVDLRIPVRLRSADAAVV